MSHLEIWYMAHPVGAASRTGVDDNLRRAGLWLRFLRDLDPERVITAPWLGALLARVDYDDIPTHRARGLRDNCAIAARCDGIVLVGGRTSLGMQAELEALILGGGAVADLTSLGALPPIVGAYEEEYRIDTHPRGQTRMLTPVELGQLRWEAP